jgi:hypothetical protein
MNKINIYKILIIIILFHTGQSVAQGPFMSSSYYWKESLNRDFLRQQYNDDSRNVFGWDEIGYGINKYGFSKSPEIYLCENAPMHLEAGCECDPQTGEPKCPETNQFDLFGVITLGQDMGGFSKSLEIDLCENVSMLLELGCECDPQTGEPKCPEINQGDTFVGVITSGQDMGGFSKSPEIDLCENVSMLLEAGCECDPQTGEPKCPEINQVDSLSAISSDQDTGDIDPVVKDPVDKDPGDNKLTKCLTKCNTTYQCTDGQAWCWIKSKDCQNQCI